MKSTRLVSGAAVFCAALLTVMYSATALADRPVVTTVPGDANNPTVRHGVISERPVTLKGAVDAASVGANWTWDPGDGSEPYTGVVGAAHWAVWAEHTYTGSSGDFFTATLTVDNGVDPAGTATFPVVIRADSVPTRANVAIAEGLWYMHRVQTRFDGDEVGVEGQAASTIPMARWDYPLSTGIIAISSQAATLNAFEANGHRENGDASNPYTETVARGMKNLMARLVAVPLDVQTVGPLAGQDTRSDDPDMNGNGLGITIDARFISGVQGFDPPYQLGMVIDAIVASGFPGAVATTGPEGVIGKTYGEIVQDMVDWYAMAQSDNASNGGWRYSAWNNAFGNHDNSTSGWAATGIVAAEDVFGTMVPDWLLTRNQNGLEQTDNESDTSDVDGLHGYTDSPNAIWGPYGTTGAAMVQMSMNALAATTSATPDERWVRAENFFRRHFDDAASGNNFKNYYYSMFNFAKAMRTAKPAPVVNIGTVAGAADGGIGCGPSAGCAAEGTKSLDWYNDPVSGLAQTVVGYQTTTGPNIGYFDHRSGGTSIGSSDDEHTQAWATQILTRTLAQAGPIAVGDVTPNPAGEGFTITLDHSRSFHQDPARSLVLFEWDIDGDGVYDLSSTELNPDPPLQVVGGFTCPESDPLPCTIQLSLRVTDDASVAVSTTDIVVLDLSIPPFAPTAIAGGPYGVCVGEQLTVDGSASFDIDEGNSESGEAPFDGITLYEWELDGVSPFDYGEASSADDPTATWTFDTVGIAPIGLRVTDNTALAFPSAELDNQTDTDNTFVAVADCFDADLSIVVISDDSEPIIPTTFRVTVTVSNGGPDDVTNVTVVGWVPSLVDVDSITPAQGSCAATGVQTETHVQYKCELGDIASGTTADVVVELFGDTEGTAEFEFTVDVEGLGPLLNLSDPDESNNTFTAVVTLIDEVIVVVAGKGKGSGAFGLLELVLFAGSVIALVALRRRRAAAARALAIGTVCLLLGGVTANDALAQEPQYRGSGFYLGAGLGSAGDSMTANKLKRGMEAAGYTVSDVKVSGNDAGWKAFAGYMFDEYIGIQLSYVDLGTLESEFTASVPPNEIDALLETATELLPGRGRGILADLLLQYPFSDRWSLYMTLGAFFAEPETKQTVISGGEGEARRKDDENDFALGLGFKFEAGKNVGVQVGFERYEIDGVKIDFPMAALSYRFGK